MNENKEITGNIGEWSEIYTLLKLLGEGKVHAGDENLEKIKDLVYPIIMIIRHEQGNTFNYNTVDRDVIIQTADGQELLRLSSSEFLKEAEGLFEVLSDKTEKTRAFPVARTQAFMDRIYCHTLKAKSVDKTDIRIVFHDPRTCRDNDMGFSIKSEVGNDSTLLNASKATNFTYRIEGYDFSDEEMENINSINTKNKIIDRVTAIQEKGGRLTFYRTDNPVFRRNLTMLDEGLAPIIAYMLLKRVVTVEKEFRVLVSMLAQDNPRHYEKDNLKDVYTYKLKHLLTSAALGMMPSKEWSGRYDANGGYLVVKTDGEVLCYHFYEKNLFEDFLFNRAYLEQSSTTRHGYAKLFRDEDGTACFKLNLQIRLK